MIVGLETFLENPVGARVIVPGDALVIIGGFYARIGDLSPPAPRAAERSFAIGR